MAGHRIYLHKSIFSVCQPQTYKDIIDIYTFTIITKASKYLGINLIKEVKDPYNKNFKPFKKQINTLENGKCNGHGLVESIL